MAARIAYLPFSLGCTRHFSSGLAPFARRDLLASSTRKIEIANKRKIRAQVRQPEISQTMETKQLNKEAHVKVFEGQQELAEGLADHIAQLSESAIKERGFFTVVLSGGSLVAALAKLAESPFVERVDWLRWHVFWVDERVVKKDDPDSSYKLAYDGLLSKVSIPSGQVYSINDALDAEGAAEDYETIIKLLVKNRVVAVSESRDLPRFDLILLGMGPDGHVASLFPNHSMLDECTKWVSFITDSPKPPPERITMTLPVINAAANVIFVAGGSGKAEMLSKVFGKEVKAGELPAQMVFPSNGKLCWFVDKAVFERIFL